MIRKKKILRAIALFLIFDQLLYLFSPTIAFALTSGPNSPEFSSFEPVATTDMVDVFSGDFTYNLPVVNIPGPDGAGYALSLSYHSGVSSEEEASWVGFGWTLNPGSIIRNKRGYPDDYKGAQVTQYNKSRPNWTVSSTLDAGLEIFSTDDAKADSELSNPLSFGVFQQEGESNSQGKERTGSILRLNAHKTIRFNNYRGFSKFTGFDLGVKGMAGLNMTKGAQGFTFNASINPSNILSSIVKNNKHSLNINASKVISEYKPIDKSNQGARKNALTVNVNAQVSASTYNIHDFIPGSMPFSVSAYSGISFNRSTSVQLNFFAPIGIEGGYTSNFNIQATQAKSIMKGYGYLYNPTLTNHGSPGSDVVLSDYTIEKGSTYETRDNYLGIPHHQADNFLVTGENLSGGFRLFHDKVGHYYPNFVHSEQPIRQMGTEFGVGGSLEIGFDFGLGKQKTTVSDWKGSIEHQQFDSESKGFFRFNNDLGGSVGYTPNNEAAAAIVMPVSSMPPDISDIGLLPLNNSSKGRSSFIDYNTYNDTDLFEKSQEIKDILDAYETSQDGIREFSVVNESGMRYTYGLPVYSRNEKNISVDVDKSEVDEAKYLAYKRVYTDEKGIVEKNRMVVGEKSAEPYAVNYLVTQINTPDYVDIGNDGPDEKDFGGWTSFRYRQWQSNNTDDPQNNWYRFRMPYNGLYYNENQLSDKRDNSGSVSTGEKQIHYLKAIETKSHIAFFITNKTTAADFSEYTNGENLTFLNGSGKDRHDGFGALKEVEIEDENGRYDIDPAAEEREKRDQYQKLEMLEKIILCSKKRLNKPLQTVNFDYNNSLCRNLPNSDSDLSYDQGGKLTLKKVWFEYEGVKRSKIAPYEFEYRYYDKYKEEVVARYAEVSEFVSQLGASTQNPDYQPYALEMWGNYQANGAERYKNHIPWVYQGFQEKDAFDPAAWNLKRIILPSGGEIHIQYEQKDYSYVQDQRAMVMTSLLQESTDHYRPEDTKYYINLKEIGLTKAEEPAYLALLQDYFVPRKADVPPHFIYFKYLYSMAGDRLAGTDNCWSEYISGYTTVHEVGKDDTGIYLRLGNKKEWGRSHDPNRNNIPKKVCYDYLVTHADGMHATNDCASEFGSLDGIDQLVAAKYDQMIRDNDYNFGGNNWRNEVASPAILNSILHIADGNPKKEQVCRYVDYKNSYLRLPVLKSKKGGGIRVKRLLMYDHGLETGDANLFGNEYIYELDDGRSSGVATNEPAAGREENALVNVLDRKNQKWFNKIIAGEDKEQNEGPLGEPLLPSPSIGHSRVVIRNIHSGKTGNGFTIQEFFTVKDFPMEETHTSLSNSDHKKRDWLKIPAGLFNFSMDKFYLAQGYRFIIHGMHGVPKKNSVYAGEYQRNFMRKASPVSYVKYEYFDFREDDLKMLKYDPLTQKFSYTLEKPGKEEDVTMEMRSVFDRTFDFTLELDIAINLLMGFPPPITVSFSPSFSLTENQLSTHVTSKVIRYPAIVKSIESYIDGGTSKTENLAFNPDTGKPVVTRTADIFDGIVLEASNGSDEITRHDGAYYSWQIPASWIYSDLGQKAMDESRSNQLTFSVGQLTSYGRLGAWLYNNFSGGENDWDIKYEWDTQSKPPAGVISAEAVVLKNQWFDDRGKMASEYGVNINQNEFNQLNLMRRPSENFAYQSEVLSANSSNVRIYGGGIMTQFEMFDWANPSNRSANWLKLSETTRYSPHGMPLEEKDILGIYSAVRFGYNHYFPVITAGNATYQSIFFEDFENNSLATKTIGHSGYSSFELNANPAYRIIKNDKDNLVLNEHLRSAGAIVKVWLSSKKPGDPGFENQTHNFNLNINNSLKVPFKKIAKTGEWTLFEAVIKDWTGIPVGAGIDAKFEYVFAAGETVYVDDFRFQPLDASAVCYVYDVNSYRLLTQFDDQHFGVYYQYNDEGQLVRRAIETERGMKTVTETQYNVSRRER